MNLKSETAWLDRYDENHKLLFTITSNFDRSWYYIYDENGKKLGKARSPDELERKFDESRRK